MPDNTNVRIGPYGFMQSIVLSARRKTNAKRSPLRRVQCPDRGGGSFVWPQITTALTAKYP